MTNLLDLTAVQARAGLDKGDFTSVELTTAYLDAAAQTKDSIIMWLWLKTKQWIWPNKLIVPLQAGSAGTLAGLPIGVKDLFATKGVPTTACSAILKDFVPPYESTVTTNLWADGAVMLGKLNCDEFAMGSANETSVFGPAVNPYSAMLAVLIWPLVAHQVVQRHLLPRAHHSWQQAQIQEAQFASLPHSVVWWV